MTEIRFGTDGVRGRFGTAPIDSVSFFRIGWAAGMAAPEKGMCLIAVDTRASGPELASAFAQGVMLAGHEVAFLGVLPTAGLALTTRMEGAEMGAMITASHNKAHDNGIKLFGRGGTKIPDAMQTRIEELLASDMVLPEPEPEFVLRPDALFAHHYPGFIRNLAPANSLAGLKLVVDCANGAASMHAPALLRHAGAEVVEIGTAPDGHNINLGCGSTELDGLRARVVVEGADVGIAFDGDADRVLLVDETGADIDGDMILAVLGTAWQTNGQLVGTEVVATIMSNLGLEEYLASKGLHLHRAPVGDRHVAARLLDTGGTLGGEQSGHILFPKLMPSGDGLAAGVMVLQELVAAGQPASQALRPFKPWPQILENVRYDGVSPLDDAGVQAAITTAKASLGADGRVLVRASGTEPLIRVMAEARDIGAARKAVDQIVQATHAAMA